MKCVRVFITGTVQGVFFRQSTRDKARDYNVKGWVRNLPDGRVEAVFCGTEFAVDQIVSWCHSGPEKAKVRHVEVVAAEPPAEEGFMVVR